MALIRTGEIDCYISEDNVALDYIDLPELAITEIIGFSKSINPVIGQPLRQEDINAATKLIMVLSKMDEKTMPQKPLLFEIAYIDVSNFAGRKSSTSPHIILITKDGTQVYWGAAYGHSNRYLEASEQEKIAKLYQFYAENKTLTGLVKYIELRRPEKAIPQP